MTDWISNHTVIGGSTSKSILVDLGKTGLTHTTATVKYLRPGGTLQSITLSSLAAINSAWSSGGFREVENNAYRLDLPDAAISAITGGGPVGFFVSESGTPRANFQLVVNESNASVVTDRLSTARAGYLDKLNIGAETLAHTGNANTFKATGFSTHTPSAVVTAMQAVAADFKATGFSTHSAANVVTAMQVVAADFKADISALATSAGLAALDALIDTLQATVEAARGAGFDTTTDSLEAIRNRGDAAWTTGAGSGGSVTGAFTVTLTVTDGINPLENALVRVGEGVTFETYKTNALGQATISRDGGTYQVSVTKPGYTSLTTTRTVTGDQAGTLITNLELSAVAIAAPADPTRSRVYLYTKDIAQPVPDNLTVQISLVSPTVAGSALPTATRILRVSEGYGELLLVKTSEMSPVRTYKVSCPTLGLDTTFSLTTNTFNLATLIS